MSMREREVICFASGCGFRIRCGGRGFVQRLFLRGGEARIRNSRVSGRSNLSVGH